MLQYARTLTNQFSTFSCTKATCYNKRELYQIFPTSFSYNKAKCYNLRELYQSSHPNFLIIKKSLQPTELYRICPPHSIRQED